MVLPDQLKVPPTRLAPSDNVKASWAEALSIDSEKATEISVVCGTSVAASLGLTEVMVGGVVSGAVAVVKLELSSPAMVLPDLSLADVITFIW